MIVRDNRKGFTLLEVMVAGTIFLMVLTAIVAIENSSRRMTKKLDSHEDVYRAAVISSAYLQQELKNAVVISTTDLVDRTVRLTYKLPLLDNTGQPTTNNRGNIMFQAVDYQLVLKPDGHLVRKADTDERHIADLGNLAEVNFSMGGAAPTKYYYNKTIESEYKWREDSLTATIVAAQDNGNTPTPAKYKFELSFYLRNQYPH